VSAPSPIDWSAWSGVIHATLMFIIKDERVLLIEKKRGLGAGKINGPGGKIDPGETPLESAVRETIEEVLVRPLAPRKLGELWFSMSDCPDILCHVFRAEDFDGEPGETDEAVPVWTHLGELPYERMWEDDRHWLPLLVAGTTFHGRFVFEGEAMRWMDMRTGMDW
jgi:8-oxo-dGTP diphosphatase